MATIPPNPTWPEIRAGMEAARDVVLTARGTVRDAETVIAAQRAIVASAETDEQGGLDDMKEWEVAVRRKLMRGL